MFVYTVYTRTDVRTAPIPNTLFRISKALQRRREEKCWRIQFLHQTLKREYAHAVWNRARARKNNIIRSRYTMVGMISSRCDLESFTRWWQQFCSDRFCILYEYRDFQCATGILPSKTEEEHHQYYRGDPTLQSQKKGILPARVDKEGIGEGEWTREKILRLTLRKKSAEFLHPHSQEFELARWLTTDGHQSSPASR